MSRWQIVVLVLLSVAAWPSFAKAQGGLVVEPEAHDFGGRLAGEVASASLDVWNDGPEPVTLDSIGFMFGAPGPFAMGDAGCVPGLDLDPGWGCELDVAFVAPATPGSYEAFVFVTSEEHSEAVFARLTGSTFLPEQMPPPQLATEPGIVEFGEVPREATSAPRSIVIRNVGNMTAVLAQGAARIGGPQRAHFDLIGSDCSMWLSPGETCAISVAFNPLTGGSAEATAELHLRSGAIGSAVPLRGRERTPQGPPAPRVDMSRVGPALAGLAKAIPGLVRGGRRGPLRLPAFEAPIDGRVTLEVRVVGMEGRRPKVASGGLMVSRGQRGRVKFSLTRQGRKLFRRPRATTAEIAVGFDPGPATYPTFWKMQTLKVRPPQRTTRRNR